jgi:uncharacterized protein (TIGR01777 family)
MKVLLTGGTGLVGRRLGAALAGRGDSVVVLTRDPARAGPALPPGAVAVAGDPTQPGPWTDAVCGCDAVVNLAGENLFARRWNADFKRTIRDSRIQATEQVVRAVLGAADRPRVLVSASAIGYYGPHESAEFTEDSPPGNDYLAGVCAEWEAAARPAAEAGVRTVLLRIGVVLDPAGGALAQVIGPFKKFVGGPVGSGRQWMSWIHHADLTGLILRALDDPAVSGPLNATAPHPVTNAEFSHALGSALGRPSALTAPAFAVRLMLGEVADIVLTGQKVRPAKARSLGYEFRFPEIAAALRDLLPA